jgi:uncharacterized protein (DUF2236 family)
MTSMATCVDAYVPPTTLPFGKGSLSWQVNMEPVIALGGGRALLLQVLHPLIAAGVEQHSNFEHDPFRRGFRTADMMLKLAFADPAVSARQADLLRRMHSKVKGVSSDGAPYDAMDPALLVWVWATLVDVSLRVYVQAVKPLTVQERDRYYTEQKLIAYACGVPEGACPDTFDDFDAYIRSVLDHELRVTKVARVVAFAGKHPPLPWPLGPLAGAVGTFFTAALLPPRFREQLGYRWSSRNERVLRAFFRSSRLAAAVIPRQVRHVPNRYLTKRKTPLGWWRNRPVRLPGELSA